jgi:opacity protein-like surface antigen
VKTKILLLIVSFLTLTFSAFADDEAKAKIRKLYLKANGIHGSFFKGNENRNHTERKYDNDAPLNSADLGVGYYINDEFRAELLYHQEFNNKFTGTRDGLRNPSGKFKRTSKNDLYALMFGVNMNVIDFDYGNIFLGGSVGMSQVKEKISNDRFASVTNTHTITGYTGGQKNNFSYGLGVGADFKISERLHAEVAYRFNDYGKTKSLLTNGGADIGKTKLKSHNALVGLRVDM